MGTLTAFLLGIATSLCATIIFDLGGPLARYVAKVAARSLPEAEREEVLEQWLADIAHMDSTIGRLWMAAGLFKAADAWPKLEPKKVLIEKKISPSYRLDVTDSGNYWRNISEMEKDVTEKLKLTGDILGDGASELRDIAKSLRERK